MNVHLQSGYRAQPRDGRCVAITTCADRADADRLARALVEARLAACVQLFPIASVYRWEGEVQTDSEVALLLKTRFERLDAIVALLERDHPYDVPELVALPVEAGLPGYLAWLDDGVRADAEKDPGEDPGEEGG